MLDFFAGSGTMGEAAAKNGRSFCLVDESPEAIAVTEKRLHRRPKDYDSAIAYFPGENGVKGPVVVGRDVCWVDCAGWIGGQWYSFTRKPSLRLRLR